MRWYHAVILLIVTGACAEPTAFECRTSEDCAGSPCVSGECLAKGAMPALHPEHASDAGGQVAHDGGDAGTIRRGPCADLVPASADNLVVNELLANVPPGPSGDANGDGVRDAFDDEFVELVNVSAEPVDMTNVRILVGGKLKYSFEPLCLMPAHSVVVFGGGSVGSSVPGGAVISEVRFAFSNSGGDVTVTAPTGTITSFAYPATGPGSLTIAPQLVGARWVEHRALSPLPFSPGRCADGREIESGCAAIEPPDMGVYDSASSTD